MSSDLLGISITGLRLSQAALSTTGHNIANAGTEGYNRQSVKAITNPATFAGAGYIGNGVNVESIDRVVNSFVVEQLRTDSTLFKDLEAYRQHITQVDNLLSDVSTGLSSGLESFFIAMQNGADDPTSLPARQLIVSEAENLSDRFNSIYDRLEVIQDGVVSGMQVAVSQINAVAESVAQLNLKISDASGLGVDSLPNDLLDQREEALRKLSELIPIQTFDQGNGHINVIIAGGQSLVVGKDSRELALAPSIEDPSFADLVFRDIGSTQPLTDFINGGEIGGLIRIREDIRASFRDIGRIAVTMADSFNNIHNMGVSLENEYGDDFFYDVNDEAVARNRVIGGSTNQPPADRRMQLLIEDSTQLTVSDYSVTIARDGLYSVERLSDNTEVATGLFPGYFPFSATFDGLELVFESGTFQRGDTFLLQPTFSAASDFSRAIVNPKDIAFGSPLLTDAYIGNTGSGSITLGEVLSLTDQTGNAIPLLSTPGEMQPPLIINFTSPTSYDVLDNSDPGKPVQLSPPMRNQHFIPGVNNKVFSEDPGETMISTNGPMIGLPEGRQAVTQTSLQIAAAVPPDFTVTDFSGSANQFSFDLVISGSLSGTNDGTHTITVSSPGVLDENALLQNINSQISTTPVEAYMTDAGTLGFRFITPGYGDISLQNYDGDPDGGADTSPVGQANNLLGFDIEATTYTTIGNADGISGFGALSNEYTSELFTITQAPQSVGLDPTTTNIFTGLHASAREIASQLSNISGVEANAFNYVELTDFQVTGTVPLQISINGENLFNYRTDPTTNQLALASNVPDPVNEPERFNNFIAAQINENRTLSNVGIYAVSGQDPDTGDTEVRIYSREGDDIHVSFRGTAGESIAVSDGQNANLALMGAGNSVSSDIVVGGRIDVSLADGVSFATTPPQSMFFGDTTASNFAQSTYLGIQVEVNGVPEVGDTFTMDFNLDAALDNRNAIAFVDLENKKIIDGESSTYSESYGTLVETIGIKTNAAQINSDAAEEVLQQTQALRNSISGVNLDDEAADLIRFEQFFSANAQVISVARDLFDRLISSF